MKDIGKTLAVLRKEHPKGVYSFAGEINAMAECFGENSAKYSYYFLSRQSPPSLEEMAVKYGDKLKCAGFVTTVGVLFPQTTDGMTLEDFFAKLNVSEYEYGTYGPVTGWITFNYNGRSVKLGTFESEDRYTNYKPTTKMKSSYPVIICEDSLVSANQKIHSGS
ncbi:MAG: hypothetical protein LBT44_02660 [Clostridiales bacterium]|nr:hypothetical protein [Clostridiales bacterium]